MIYGKEWTALTGDLAIVMTLASATRWRISLVLTQCAHAVPKAAIVLLEPSPFPDSSQVRYLAPL